MTEAIHDLHSFMAQATSDMAAEYARIYARAAEDKGTAGDEGESNWAEFIKYWLPAGYHVRTKGRLIGADGIMSKQIDVVVLKPSYPPGLLEKKIWLAAGVAAVFECKNTLTSADVKGSLERCKSFKSLVTGREGTPRRELQSPMIYGLLAHSHSWKGPASDPCGNIDRALQDGEASVDHPSRDVDVICVSDLAIWTSNYIAKYEADWSGYRQQLEVVFGGSWGVMTTYSKSSLSSDQQVDHFRPVGALIYALSKRLAWEDESLRDIAEYYQAANLLGSGGGAMRPWPANVYSDAVKERISRGGLSNGPRWDDWSISQF